MEDNIQLKKKECVAPNCNQKFRHGKLSFHRFPIFDRPFCEKWIAALKVKNIILNRQSIICGKHFRPIDYDLKNYLFSQRYVLKKDAVPSLFQYNHYTHDETNVEENHTWIWALNAQKGVVEITKKESPNNTDNHIQNDKSNIKIENVEVNQINYEEEIIEIKNEEDVPEHELKRISEEIIVEPEVKNNDIAMAYFKPKSQRKQRFEDFSGKDLKNPSLRKKYFDVSQFTVKYLNQKLDLFQNETINLQTKINSVVDLVNELYYENKITDDVAFILNEALESGIPSNKTKRRKITNDNKQTVEIQKIETQRDIDNSTMLELKNGSHENSYPDLEEIYIKEENAEDYDKIKQEFIN